MPRPYLRSPSAAAVPSLERWVYFFGNGRADGSAAMRDILGGKGAGLAEMANLGLPVPPGFTISAKLCLTYLEQGTFPHQLHEEVDRHLKQLEQATKKRFGDPANPLLVSVRSGAAVSMPGMMETILNLGLNDDTVQGLIAGSKNPRFAYDSYRRFVQMYGDVVFDLGKQPFEEVLAEFKQRRKVTRDIDLPADDLKALAQEFKSIIQAKRGAPTPEPIAKMKRGALAKVYGELERIAAKLERHFRDVQDIEFTFERGKLYMLQTRRAQRTGLAAVRIAVELVDERLITPDEAVQRVPPQDLDQLFHPMVDPDAAVTVVAKGLPASPGAATGEAGFDPDEAESLTKKGHKGSLGRPETSPEGS